MQNVHVIQSPKVVLCTHMDFGTVSWKCGRNSYMCDVSIIRLQVLAAANEVVKDIESCISVMTLRLVD